MLVALGLEIFGGRGGGWFPASGSQTTQPDGQGPEPMDGPVDLEEWPPADSTLQSLCFLCQNTSPAPSCFLFCGSLGSRGHVEKAAQQEAVCPGKVEIQGWAPTSGQQ